MDRVWIDMPNGQQYGFPKLYDNSTPLLEWLINNEYPQQEINNALQYLRWWSENDN